MERRQKLITGLNFKSDVIAEIGALCSPLVTKAEADVRFIDYASAEVLRKHYSGNPGVDPDRIVETDAIWGEQTLFDALGQRVDFILASHVIEHVPDLVTWLNELHSALNDDGQVRLAIPDKRFTFDFLRRESELSDVLAAYIASARIPQPQAILDYLLNATHVDHIAAWRGEVSKSTLQRPDSFASAMQKAGEAIKDGTYHDAHCWVFTPESFATLLEQLSMHGLIKFSCDNFYDTEPDNIEFFVSLRTSNDVSEMAESWRQMAKSVRHSSPSSIASLERELMSAIADAKKNDPRPGPEEDSLDEHQNFSLIEAELQRTRESLERAVREIRLLKKSNSWRLTQPLRSMAGVFRQLKNN
ncbi:methyltransferase domain-containing protein [Dyella silvatica]|uniref:methyltransferase domain-containing protein n=1 Tax=Dyella silvatica TaxID=2992128 RepID=UPI002257481C|nr:methyltransferase domain-containing protein [Dyella silvatica]